RPRRKDLRGGRFHDLERPLQRLRGEAGNLDGVQLLEAVQRSRFEAGANGGDRRQGDELTVRPGDVDVGQLARRQASGPLDLGYHLVAAPVDVEAVDEVAAQHRRQV